MTDINTTVSARIDTCDQIIASINAEMDRKQGLLDGLRADLGLLSADLEEDKGNLKSLITEFNAC